MARRIHAREMEYYNDSSEDEAILFEGDDSDDSDEVPTARGCTNPHPISNMQSAFDESIADSAEQYRTGKPALELSSISAEERRKRLLSGEDYNDTYSAMWRENPSSRFHPLRKIVAQITYGVHLLHVQMAVSNEEVVKILQRHIDQVDELIRRADEDLGMALADIEVRISHLKFALADRTTFDTMLENRPYRAEILRGNDLIEDMIKRTENLMTDLLADIKVGSDSIKEMSNYMARIGSTWPMSTTDLGIYNTMLLNTEGWLECFDSLKLEGKSLSGCLMQLSALVEEMARRAENASKKQALTSKSNTSLASQSSLNLPIFPTRQSSSSLIGKAMPALPALPAIPSPQQPLTPAGSITPTDRLSMYTPPQIPSDNMNLPVRRKTNISERRATAISEKRSSTATIASLFIGMDDDDLPPAVPELPKAKKSVKKSKIPKMPKLTRPRRISISSITAKSKSQNQNQSTKEKQRVSQTDESKELPPKPVGEKIVPVQTQTQVLTVASVLVQNVEAKGPVQDPDQSRIDDASISEHTPQPSPQPSNSDPMAASPQPNSVSDSPEKGPTPINRSVSPHLLSPSSSDTSPYTFKLPQLPFAESPVLGYSGTGSPNSVPSPLRSSPSHSPAPSIVVRRKPLPGSASSPAAPTPKIQHSPQPSTAIRAVEQPSVVVNGGLKPQLDPPRQLHRHQPSKSSLLSEPSQRRSMSPEQRIAGVSQTPSSTAEHSPICESAISTPIEVLVPQVLPLLDEPIDLDLAPLTSRRFEPDIADPKTTTMETDLNRLSSSSNESYESSIVPLSELAHPFRSNSPELVGQARSDSPAEGLGIDFPITKNSSTVETSAVESSSTTEQSPATPEIPMASESPLIRKPAVAQESTIEEESEPESAPTSVRSQSPANIVDLETDSSEDLRSSEVESPIQEVKSVLQSTESTGSTADSQESSSISASRTASPQPIVVKKPEVYQPKSMRKVESVVKQPETKVDSSPYHYPHIDFDRSGSPLPFLHSATHSTCHSASLSVASNVNKALPAIPKEGSDFNLSPPQSPMAPSFFSSFSRGKASDGGHENSSFGRAEDSSQLQSSRSQPPKPIDTKAPGMRAMSPLAPDSAYSAGSTFASSLKDEPAQRPQTSRSMKPSRSKLALFPHTSPSMLDLRTKSDMALPLAERSTTYADDSEANVGEEADSALPAHPPRLVPRPKDGGRTIGAARDGMGTMGTKLKKLMGFGRKNQKVVGVS